MTTQALRIRLDSILQFITPHLSWVNCHMVNYLTDDHWKTYVPLELQQEIPTTDFIEECIETIFWSSTLDSGKKSKFPKFTEFCKQAQLHSLHAFDEIITTPHQFKENILKLKGSLKQQIKIKEFLTEKKRHEVELTARLVNDLIDSSLWRGSSVIVDAGDGKGYLSSRLALEYGYKVLGIDSNSANTKNAMERSKKLKKAWNGLKERSELESKGIAPARRGNSKLKVKRKGLVNEQTTEINESYNYKTIDKSITSDMDLDELVQEQFSEFFTATKPTTCLTGLHTCGNLAATSLKIFNIQKSCKLICNIGCCYHLLREEFSGNEIFGNKQILEMNEDYGFPLSQYLKTKKITLGRNARMLAAQSIERTVNAKELPNISLFYRALLEFLICEEHPDLRECVQVGKIRKFKNFAEYVKLCKIKYSNLNLKSDRIAEVMELQKHSKSYLDLFYLLRMTFARVLESVILLDRLLYLKELGHSHSFLIPIFDPVISPRHFAIVAWKKE